MGIKPTKTPTPPHQTATREGAQPKPTTAPRLARLSRPPFRPVRDPSRSLCNQPAPAQRLASCYYASDGSLREASYCCCPLRVVVVDIPQMGARHLPVHPRLPLPPLRRRPPARRRRLPPVVPAAHGGGVGPLLQAAEGGRTSPCLARRRGCAGATARRELTGRRP